MTITGLKRVLGLPEAVFICIGYTIGAGVFVFTGLVAKITGPALPLAYGLAVIPVFISMMPIAMLGSVIPTVGGNYRYPSRMVSPGLAFVGIWFCPAVGILMILFFSLVILADMNSLLEIILFFIFILSGIGVYQLRKKALLKKGIDLRDLTRDVSWLEQEQKDPGA